ncbi:hypothetical protein EG68_03040 [Paragonimus skrjabini miyazakii]|uniref:Uncharacterized protein n=1 Tax=Paragonimus skrjabini miyazakii TaxID=59628 RepID=A0A8S9YXF4_9TREM|nr:hypothetical protein EG68_03040 [Paragonimus skrjabini miyazakii]
MLLLVLSCICLLSTCQGFNPLFAFESTKASEDGKTLARLHLPSAQDGLIFQPRIAVPIYDRVIDKFTVFKNGLVALDDESVRNFPNNYPENTVSNGKRLQTLNGRYLSVFTSVNNGPSGTITVREINPNDKDSLGCVNTKQLERINRLIHLRYPTEESTFMPQSITLITWENMTNDHYGILRSNSFGLAILTNGSRSYAIFQYWQIQWPEQDKVVSHALPPEAGVFMTNPHGFQLPRSGHSVDTTQWTNETNVALPGEWLIPLYDAPVESDERVEWLPKIAEEFLESIHTTCHVRAQHDDFNLEEAIVRRIPKTGGLSSDLMNDSPTDSSFGLVTEPTELEPYHYTDEWDEDYDYGMGGAGTQPNNDSFWASYHEELKNQFSDTVEPTASESEMHSTVGTRAMTNLPEIIPETVQPLGLYDGDSDRVHTVEPEITSKTYIPLEENFASEVYDHRYKSESPSTYAERCDAATECKVQDSECYRVQGMACCVCRDQYYGSGNKQCWADDQDYHFVFQGNLTAKWSQDGNSFSLPIYLDIQNGRSKRSSSGVRDGQVDDPNYQTVRLFTPMFHILNALIATSCRNAFSIFNTLVNSLQPHGSPSTVEVTNTDGPISLIKRAYREANSVTGTVDRSYYASYRLDNYGRVIFPEHLVKFVAETRGTTEEETSMDEMDVRWSAIADITAGSGEDSTANCLTQPEGPVSQDQTTYIRMLDRGYCGEDCSSSQNGCNLFCVDIPLISAHEPDACSCIRCTGEGEVCRPDGGSYSCDCGPGLRRMEDRTCRADPSLPDIPLPEEQCGPVRCHQHARCIDTQQGLCQCLPGFRGDGQVRCEDDPCARCLQNEVCVNDVCRPTGVNLCEGIRCGKQAFCRDGACVCNAGYTGDPMVECIEERELCAGVQCHRFGQCYENRCYCSHGYVGDGVNFCDVHTEDPCDGVRCAANANCRDGRCTCVTGYEGDGYTQCLPSQDKCANVQCHSLAQCYDGQCRCQEGYDGDGYRECRPKGRCTDEDCHPYAHCVTDRCQCKPGYEGDGYTKCRQIQSVTPKECGDCRGIPLKELAQCIDGRCVCATGFIEAHPGVCMECVQSNCHPDALCQPTQRYNNAYSCQCKSGYSGDGVKMCEPGDRSGTGVDPTCGGGCHVRNAECNRASGRCECRRGYDGDGQTKCSWNCQLCVPDAICDRENERCNCKPGYYGDGQAYCEKIPTRPDLVRVHITGQGDVMRVADIEKPLVLNCYVTTNDESVTGQWTQPKGSQPAVITINRLDNGTEISLRIVKPAMTDAGRYFCRASQAEAFIDVVIEETAVPYDIFLTSDDGILKVRSSGQNSSIATLWNLAENNKYGRVAMVTDCNTQRVIYTSDYGHEIRVGDAHAKQKELSTISIYQSQVSRFRNLAVDPPSGNIYSWDEAFGKLVVLNPAKPHMLYTLDSITSLKQGDAIRFAGLALHSSQGLLYWATFTDGWMPNGTIQVASMNGQNEKQLIQLDGEPLALSLSPSYDNTDNSAGRLCWIQRSITNMFALATEMHCARLSVDGRQILMKERLRQFNPTEEPSWGMVHHRGTVLWTDASRPVFYSANPARRVHVRLVCCSNRFQAIAALAKCNPAMSNACGYSNGRCRYFCLPNEDNRSRTCVCPDSEVGCHKEV